MIILSIYRSSFNDKSTKNGNRKQFVVKLQKEIEMIKELFIFNGDMKQLKNLKEVFTHLIIKFFC